MTRILAPVSLFLLSLAFVLAGCAGESTITPVPIVPEVADTAAESAPAPTTTAGQADIGILFTPTARPHPPTPTPAPTRTPPLTPTQAMPTNTKEAETGKAEAEPAPTFVPSPTEKPVPEPMASEMVLVPAGEFIMGSSNEDERPPHAVFVDAFEIDKFEVANDEFQRFVDETGYLTEGEQAGEGDTWRAWAEGRPRHPVVKVTFNDAQAYCEWAGKRLPSEAEWEKAARGAEQLVYPWGNEWDPDRANTKESGYRGTTVVGSFPQGASPYGAMDMAGNVAEWTTDWFKAYPGGDFASPYFGERYRVIRGGGWFAESDWVRTTERSASSEDLRNDDVGFRCVRPVQ